MKKSKPNKAASEWFVRPNTRRLSRLELEALRRFESGASVEGIAKGLGLPARHVAELVGVDPNTIDEDAGREDPLFNPQSKKGPRVVPLANLYHNPLGKKR